MVLSCEGGGRGWGRSADAEKDLSTDHDQEVQLIAAEPPTISPTN
jgi:hypothetical protein